LYNKISQAYASRPGESDNLQANLDGVKRTLAETRRATGVEFLCFRQNKERDKGGEKKSSSSGTKSRREKDKKNREPKKEKEREE
jgi:exocyst complex component 2